MSAKKLSNQHSVTAHAHSRREFLTRTSLLAGGILAFGLPFLNDRTRPVFAMQSRKTIQNVRYWLELDGAIVGPLNSMKSGFVSGEIITYQDGDDLFFRKRLGRLKYEDIVLTCGGNLSLPFYQWLGETLGQQSPRKNGAIVVVNPNGQIIDRRVIQNALVKEVTFPALDGSSKDPAYFKVTITPERIQYQSASSGQTVPPQPVNRAILNSSKFRLNIQGLEQACAFVQRIAPLVVKQEIINYVDGGEGRIAAGRKEVGNLIITLPMHEAGPFTEWFSSFVLQGQWSGNAKQGILEFLAPNGQAVLAAVTLGNIGIFGMSPVPPSSQSNAVSMVKVEMYCETMQLTKFPGSGASQPAPTTKKKTPSTQRRAPRPKSRTLPRIKNLTPRLPRKQ